jgi:hypothetical protein
MHTQKKLKLNRLTPVTLLEVTKNFPKFQQFSKKRKLLKGGEQSSRFCLSGLQQFQLQCHSLALS